MKAVVYLTTLLLLAPLAGIFPATSISGSSQSLETLAREPHAPIEIGSDAEWTPANGVRSGTGTLMDPYIIERWDITGGDSTCISISNTRAYAIIRDNHLHHANGLKHGITLKNAENLILADNDIDHVHHGIHTEATEVVIENNRITDIEARGVMIAGSSNRLTARGNYLENTGVYGFNLDGGGSISHAGEWRYPALVENNTISGATYGIYLNTAAGTFRNNTIYNTGYGVHCKLGMSWDRAVQVTLEGNLLKYNTFGLYVSLPREPGGGGVSSATIRGNLVERNLIRGLWLLYDADYLIENNTVALNPVGIDDLAFGKQTFANNTVKFNLGGLILRSLFRMDPDSEQTYKIRVVDNDIHNNAYFALRNDYHHAPGKVSGNYYGGVPGSDGDLLEGNLSGDYRSSPNDPETPPLFSNVTVVEGGESVSITSDTTLSSHYFLRHGARFTIDNANVDLDGHWIAAKRGSYLNLTAATLSDGLTLAVATDLAHLESSTFDNLVAGVSVYRATPFLGNLTVQNENTSYSPGSSRKTKFLLEPAGFYLYRDQSRINGGTLNTGGAFGIFAVNSRARVSDLSITNNQWGVGAREGALRLEGVSISSCTQAAITNYDGWWYYGNLSLTIEGADLQNNPLGVELKEGQYEGAGTPHDLYLANTTINGGDTALEADLTDSLLVGNTFTNNGLTLHGTRVQIHQNRISRGSGLRLLQGETLRLENNTFENNDKGLHVVDSTPLMVNNDFTSNQYGVYAEQKAQPKIKYNNFEDNLEYGVYNDDSSTPLNATYNWWNAADGPSGEGSGSGDAVSKYVSYVPWLTAESDHQGHYENLPPEKPSLLLPSTATLSFAARGWAHDPEGDIIRRVELRLANATYDSDWLPTRGLWREVAAWGGYAHIFDALNLSGDYSLYARAFDGYDYSDAITKEIRIDPPALEKRGPIVIVSNEGFTPANGVRSGSGTAADPYIIERWDIFSGDADAISISNADAFVVIRMCNIHGNNSNDGITLSNAQNVRVEESRLVENDHQIVLLDDSRARVETSLFITSEGDGIRSSDSYVDVFASLFLADTYALSVLGGPEQPMNFTESIFLDGTIYLDSMNSSFSKNLVIGPTLYGGTTGDDEYSYQISDSVFSHGAGVWFNKGTVEISGNLLVDGSWGVYGDRSVITLRNNNIFGNEHYGVENYDDSETIDARSNWWGAANGPSGASDGDGDAVSDDVDFDPWLTAPHQANQPPSLEILEPDGNDNEADANYTILWSASDPDGDELTLDFYYDNDTNPDNGTTLIMTGLADTGSYDWNTTAIEAGDYYVYGVADDNNGSWAAAYSPGTVRVTHGGGPVNHPPSITITRPAEAGEGADDSYTVEWSADDPDGDELTLDLYFDDDTDPDDNMTLIVEGLADTGSYDWNTSTVAEGDYYVYGVADDNNGSASSAYSAGTVRVDRNDPPTLEITKPAEAGEGADDSYTVEWSADDPDGDELTLNLYFDEDTDPDNGRTLIVEGLADTGSYEWDTSAVAEGDYYLYGVADDNNGSQSSAYSDYPLAVHHPAPENRPPELRLTAPLVGQELHQGVKVRWTATDPEGDPLSVGLGFWTAGMAEPAPLASGLGARGSWYWDTSALAEGSYLLAASASDGAVVVRENVTVTIDHPDPAALRFTPDSFALDPPQPEEGQTVLLTVTVANEGDVFGAAIVEFYLDDDSYPFYTDEVEAVAGGPDSAFGLWKAQVGSHTLTARIVAESGVVDTASMEVEVASLQLPAGNEEDSRWWVWVGLLGLVAAGVAVVGVGYRWRRRNGNGPALQSMAQFPEAPVPGSQQEAELIWEEEPRKEATPPPVQSQIAPCPLCNTLLSLPVYQQPIIVSCGSCGGQLQVGGGAA